MSSITKTNLKNVLIGVLVISAIPLLGIVMNVIYTYGAYVGTQARTMIEAGICR